LRKSIDCCKNFDGKCVIFGQTQGQKPGFTPDLGNKEPSLDIAVNIGGVLPFRNGSVLRLSATSLESSSGVSFGGAMVKSDGTWCAATDERIQASDGMVLLHLPAAGAAVLIMER